MLVIKVVGAQATVRDITAKDGKSYSFRTQEGRLAINGEVRKVELSLGKEQSPYPIGDYVIGDESFVVDRFSRLQLRERLELKPAAAAAGRPV